MGLAKFFILWKSLCMMKPKECLSLKAFALLLLLLRLGESCLSFHVLASVGEATATARRRLFDVLLIHLTRSFIVSLSLFLCVRIYVCKYVKCVRSFSFLCMYVCTKCCRGPLVQYISFWFLALLSSVCNITRCSCSDQTLWLLPLLLLYIRSGDCSEDRGNDTTLTDSLFTYVCMYLYV